MTEARADLFAIMDAAPDALEFLRSAILDGRIEGMLPNVSANMKLGCIKAHVAKYYNQKSSNMPGAARAGPDPKDRTPIEKYTYDIKIGDTPESSQVLNNVMLWLDEWQNETFEFEPDEGYEL